MDGSCQYYASLKIELTMRTQVLDDDRIMLDMVLSLEGRTQTDRRILSVWTLDVDSIDIGTHSESAGIEEDTVKRDRDDYSRHSKREAYAREMIVRNTPHQNRYDGQIDKIPTTSEDHLRTTDEDDRALALAHKQYENVYDHVMKGDPFDFKDEIASPATRLEP